MTQRGTVVIALSLLFFVSGYSRQDDIRVLAGLSLGQRPSAAPANVIVSRATRSGAETDSLGLKIDTVFAEWKYPQSPGGAIAIVKDGRLIFMKGYGCADLENAVAMTPSTKVYMASISKQFTGYCVARLIGDGKLNLNDDIRKYIPEMQSFGHAIKVKDLVYHKSGLRDLYGLLPLTGFRLNGCLSNDDVLKVLYKQRDLNFLPGAEWEYSNTNYFFLAEIVKRITRESLKTWAERVIFEPLGMKNTLFVDSIETLVPLRAKSYHQNRDGSFSNDPFLDVTVGHTGLYSTAEDMSKWLLHLRDLYRRKDPLLAMMLHTDTLINGRAIDNYSFGLFKTSQKAMHYWHRGSLFGFKSMLSYYPEDDFGLVILGNVQTFNRIRYAREVTRLLHPAIAQESPVVQTAPVLNDSLKNKQILVDPSTLRKYEGSYALDSMTVYMVRVRDHSLSIAEVRSSRTTDLVPISENEFRNHENSLLISFSENNQGVVEKMTYQTSSTKATGVRAKVLSYAQEQEIIGEYYNDELEISIRIEKTPRGLEASNLALGKIDLYPTVEDQFRCDHDFFSCIILHRNANKNIDGFLMDGFRVRKLEFVKR